MTRFWFRPKRYGYGARPVTWQGWLLSLLPALVAVAGTWWVTGQHRAESIALVSALLLVVLVTTLAVILISRQKTDGAWRWRWGRWRS